MLNHNQRHIAKQIGRVLLALIFLGFLAVSTFHLMEKTIFPKIENEKQVGHQQVLFLPVLFLP